MITLKFSVHSFIDLITNSSSETFTSSDEKTLEAVKLLVNRLLSAGGSTKTFDDFFSGYVGFPVDIKHDASPEVVQAAKEQGVGKWDDVVLTEELITKGIEEGWLDEDNVNRTRGDAEYCNSQVVIIGKNNDEETKKLVQSLNGVISGFGETYTYYS